MSLSSCIHNCITSIHSILGKKWCTLYLSLFDQSNQRFHLQVSDPSCIHNCITPASKKHRISRTDPSTQKNHTHNHQNFHHRTQNATHSRNKATTDRSNHISRQQLLTNQQQGRIIRTPAHVRQQKQKSEQHKSEKKIKKVIFLGPLDPGSYIASFF